MRSFAHKQKPTNEVKFTGSTRSGPVLSGQNRDVNSIFHVQRTIGNQAVLRLLQANREEFEADLAIAASTRFPHDISRIPLHAISRTKIQPKANVSIPGDVHERDADRAADHVMHMPEPQSEHTSTCDGCSKSQARQSEQGHKLLQAKHVRTSTSEQTTLPPILQEVQRSPGQPLEPATQAYFESRFGIELDQVRVQTGDRAERAAGMVDAQAFAVGDNIVFGKGKYAPDSSDGRRLLAHELAHVVSPSHTGLMRRVSPNYHRIRASLTYSAFHGKTVITCSDGHNVLVILASLSARDLNDTLAKMESDSLLNRLLENISSADLVTYNTIIQKILQRIQRTGAKRFASGLGLTSQAQMAQAQANYMHGQATTAAQAAHGPAPTAAQISAQQAARVRSTSIATQTGTLSAADESSQNAAATTARTRFVTWVQAAHPTLNIGLSDIRIDSRAVFNRGQGVIAFAQAGQAVVGYDFARVVNPPNGNPAYALPTIIHELRGHKQYGPYGQAGSEYGLELYDQAARLMPGYTQPTGAGRTSEIDAYAYQETEIYALMIEVPYYTPTPPAHSALASINVDPAPQISVRIGIIKTQFESRVARSLLRGLFLRFRADPRLTPKARTAFKQGIRNNFPAAQAARILQ